MNPITSPGDRFPSIPAAMATETPVAAAAAGPLDAAGLAAELSSLAQRAGIHQWDLGAACSTDTSVQVDRGEPKQMKGAQRSAITVRVWNDQGLVGITSTSDLSAAGLARALAGAHQASAFGNPDDTPAFSPLATAPLPQLDQPLHEPRSILSLLDTLREAEQELLGAIRPSAPSRTTAWPSAAASASISTATAPAVISDSPPPAFTSTPVRRRPAASRAAAARCAWPMEPISSMWPAASMRLRSAPSPISTTSRSSPGATPASSAPRPSLI